MIRNKFWPFFLIFFLGSLFFLSHKDIINTDIFSLLKIDITKKNQEIFNEFNARNRSNIIFASMNNKNMEIFANFIKSQEIFESIDEQNNDIDMEQIFKYKFAILSRDNFNILNTNKDIFLNHSAAQLLNPFVPKIKGDIFGFLYQSSFVNGEFESIFDKEIDGKRYKVLYTKLKSNYDKNQLKNTISFAINLGIFFSGQEIFNIVSNEQAKFESILFTLLSVSIVFVILFYVFRSLKIYILLLVPIFGLTCGLLACIIIYKSVSFITAIVGTSLVGLMLDFAIYWLSSSIKNIKYMRQIFIVGLLITSLGYGLFLLSGFRLLQEIAVFSVAALIGSFSISYFILPEIINKSCFNKSKTGNIVNLLISFGVKFSLILKPKNIILILFIAILSFGVFIKYLNYKEDISTYANIQENLKKNAYLISKLQGTSLNFLISKNLLDEERVILEFKSNMLINNYQSLSKFFLSPQLQQKVYLIFKKININDLSDFKKLGFGDDFLSAKLDEILKTPILRQDMICRDKNFDKFQIFCSKDGLISFFDIDMQKYDMLKSIAKEYNSEFFNYQNELNLKFEKIKKISIILKVISILLAFFILWIFFGFIYSLQILFMLFLSILLTMIIFLVFGISFDIFAVFGLILASAIGIDYMIFALNDVLEFKERILAIFVAALTSFFTFFILSFSSTPAVQSFGISTSSCMLFCFIFSIILSCKHGYSKK